MVRSNFFSTLGSLCTATLLTGALLLGGCSDSLTGTTPPEADETVQTSPAEHNSQASDDDGTDTEPGAGHNTSDED